jgi:hypothetical protein
MKLKKQAPMVNLNCDELRERRGISLIEIKEEAMVKNATDKPEAEVDKRISKIEKMISEIQSSVKLVQDEIRELKTGFLGGDEGDEPLRMKTFDDIELDLDKLSKVDFKSDNGAFDNLFKNVKQTEDIKEIPIVDSNKVWILKLPLGI